MTEYQRKIDALEDRLDMLEYILEKYNSGELPIDSDFYTFNKEYTHLTNYLGAVRAQDIMSNS